MPQPKFSSTLVSSGFLARFIFKAGATAVVALATAGAAQAADAIKAYELCTGADNASHVLVGTIDQAARTDVSSLHFKQTAAHSSYSWHQDPEPQYVMTLSGTLAFSTKTGENLPCTLAKSCWPRTTAVPAIAGSWSTISHGGVGTWYSSLGRKIRSCPMTLRLRKCVRHCDRRSVERGYIASALTQK